MTGHGVHLVTVNDYLSKVGAVAMGPLYHFLGLSVGIIQGQSQETGDSGGTYIFDPEYRHPDPRYDFAPACQPCGARLTTATSLTAPTTSTASTICATTSPCPVRNSPSPN